MNSSTLDLLSVREAAQQRRSIRAFEPEAIPQEDLLEILDVVRLAPSAFNLQPWRFVIVEDADLKDRLAAAAFNQRQVRSAPAVIALYTDMEDTLAHVEEVAHPGLDAEARERTVKMIRGMFGAQSVEEREAWAAAQGHIALGYLLLAAAAHGYQTSPMSGFNPQAVKELLGLPEAARVPALIAIGKGTEEGFPAHRHPLERIVRVA
jgi:nitroreductase